MKKEMHRGWYYGFRFLLATVPSIVERLLMYSDPPFIGQSRSVVSAIRPCFARITNMLSVVIPTHNRCEILAKGDCRVPDTERVPRNIGYHRCRRRLNGFDPESCC